VVDISLKENMRSHYDLNKGNAPYFSKAQKVGFDRPLPRWLSAQQR